MEISLEFGDVFAVQGEVSDLALWLVLGMTVMLAAAVALAILKEVIAHD